MVTKDRASLPPILQVGDVLLSPDIVTEYFACDIARCGGRCCEEGDAGAPVTLDEIAEIEEQLDDLWPRLSASAQSEIDRTGVAYPDPEGELVTCIVNHRDCAFRGPRGCLLRQRPISCHLYPIREKQLGIIPASDTEPAHPLIGLNYHRWEICRDAVERGKREGIRLYQFLRTPLVRRFGEAWYEELEQMVAELKKTGMLWSLLLLFFTLGWSGNVRAEKFPERVKPLLTTHWGQGHPYNILAPARNFNGLPYRPLAGCGAVAMAQLINYHRFPEDGPD